MKALIPTKLGLLTYRIEHFDTSTNDESLRTNIELLKDKRECTLLRLAQYQQELHKYYDYRIKTREYHLRELVLPEVNQNTTEPRHGKLGLNWEGPYEIIHVGNNVSYILGHLETKIEPLRLVNVSHLRSFFI